MGLIDMKKDLVTLDLLRTLPATEDLGFENLANQIGELSLSTVKRNRASWSDISSQIGRYFLNNKVTNTPITVDEFARTQSSQSKYIKKLIGNELDSQALLRFFPKGTDFLAYVKDNYSDLKDVLDLPLSSEEKLKASTFGITVDLLNFHSDKVMPLRELLVLKYDLFLLLETVVEDYKFDSEEYEPNIDVEVEAERLFRENINTLRRQSVVGDSISERREDVIEKTRKQFENRMDALLDSLDAEDQAEIMTKFQTKVVHELTDEINDVPREIELIEGTEIPDFSTEFFNELVSDDKNTYVFLLGVFSREKYPELSVYDVTRFMNNNFNVVLARFKKNQAALRRWSKAKINRRVSRLNDMIDVSLDSVVEARFKKHRGMRLSLIHI